MLDEELRGRTERAVLQRDDAVRHGCRPMASESATLDSSLGNADLGGPGAKRAAEAADADIPTYLFSYFCSRRPDAAPWAFRFGAIGFHLAPALQTRLVSSSGQGDERDRGWVQ